ncbi:MAG TPA: hypothetical protein VMT95_11585 [Candidatus Binatia bacterium]|nr:hypothetical protein [Candidatus Binatia bacterium]
MRMDAKTLGAGGAIAVVFLLVGLLIRQCPADGNPVGFHIDGSVKLDNAAAFQLSKCKTTTCTLAFELRTSANPPAQPSPCPATSNCFHFTDSGKAMTVTITDSDKKPRTYPDYADGTVTITP